MTPDPSLPYHGLRVLDISQGIAGPYCAQILSEQGADVIKVEPPNGDWGRFIGVIRGEHSALSIQYNAGKRAVAIDARQDAGRQLLRRLADRADVIVQNFRPGIVERMGLGYPTLAAQRPELVYVSISGYGPGGPYRDAPATDSVMQADSGLMVTNQDEH
ncbi:MAG: CoA transferase, partial [Burkholderiaceae bacterium]